MVYSDMDGLIKNISHQVRAVLVCKMELVRFGVVGIVSTAVYLLLSISLTKLNIADPFLSSILAILVSFVISYLGHYAFTFKVSGSHTKYFPRFGATQIAIFVMLSGLSGILFKMTFLDPIIINCGIAIVWPVLSFLLNKKWAFKKP